MLNFEIIKHRSQPLKHLYVCAVCYITYSVYYITYSIFIKYFVECKSKQEEVGAAEEEAYRV